MNSMKDKVTNAKVMLYDARRDEVRTLFELGDVTKENLCKMVTIPDAVRDQECYVSYECEGRACTVTLWNCTSDKEEEWIMGYTTESPIVVTSIAWDIDMVPDYVDDVLKRDVKDTIEQQRGYIHHHLPAEDDSENKVSRLNFLYWYEEGLVKTGKYHPNREVTV